MFSPTSSLFRSLSLWLVSEENVDRPRFVLPERVQHSLVRPHHYGCDGAGEIALLVRRVNLGRLDLCILANPDVYSSSYTRSVGSSGLVGE